jgi:hypothetical protein
MQTPAPPQASSCSPEAAAAAAAAAAEPDSSYHMSTRLAQLRGTHSFICSLKHVELK